MTLLIESNLPACEGGKPIRQTFLPLALPSTSEEEKEAVTKVLESGWLTHGSHCQQFEKAFALQTQAPYAISLSSCTAALHLALIASNIKAGDEVITSPITFAATANVILHEKASPIFTDVDPFTLNIDPKKIEEKITKKTKAIIVVHLAGRPCKMEAIQKIAKKYNLTVIEDAAHAHGSQYQGKPIGSISDFTCFSFYPTKNITAAEGGMITTKDQEKAEQLRLLSMHGMSKTAWKRHSQEENPHWQLLLPGYKYNMTDLQAAIGLVQMKKLNAFKAERKNIVEQYNKAFSSYKELFLPPPPSAEEDICWHLYTLQLNLDQIKISRDAFASALKKENIGVGFHFIGLHLQPLYKAMKTIKPHDLPNATQASERILSLPLYPGMQQKDVDDVIHAVIKLINYYRH